MSCRMSYNNDVFLIEKNLLSNPLGVINENLLVLHFLLEIYIQLEQKCQSELVEDIKKDTFRQAQCDNLV